MTLTLTQTKTKTKTKTKTLTLTLPLTRYGIKGIPTLVLLDGEGNLVNASITGAHGQYL